jgi:hypothetical protein
VRHLHHKALLLPLPDKMFSLASPILSSARVVDRASVLASVLTSRLTSILGSILASVWLTIHLYSLSLAYEDRVHLHGPTIREGVTASPLPSSSLGLQHHLRIVLRSIQAWNQVS